MVLVFDDTSQSELRYVVAGNVLLHYAVHLNSINLESDIEAVR